MAIFARQFSVMIDAGLPLVQCLEILGNQQDNKAFARRHHPGQAGRRAGHELESVVEEAPQGLDDLYANMVAAGEAGGILDTILQRLAQYIEKAAKLKAQVRSAMIYPIAVIISPPSSWPSSSGRSFRPSPGLFAGLGAELPADARSSCGCPHFGEPRHFRHRRYRLLIYVLKKYHETYKGRRVIDGYLLRVPVIGEILRKIAVARFCRTLST